MKRLAGVLAGAGLMVAAVAGPAAAAPTPFTVTKGLTPYAIFEAHATYGTVGIGSTNPGQPDGEICLRVAIASDTNLWLSDFASGDVLDSNGPTAGGSVVYTNLLQTFAPAPACTLNATNLTWSGKVTPAVGSADIQIKLDSFIDRGIKSNSASSYLVTHPSGATVTVPTCPALKYTCSTTAAGPTATVVTVTSATPIISKAKLELISTNLCTLEESDVDTATHPITTGPFSTGPYTDSYVQCPEVAGQNKISGSPVIVHVAGSPGAVSASFVQTTTSSVQLWDQTLGLCKIADQPSRAVSCKGDWGDVVPLNIVVRDKAGVTGGSPFGNPAGLTDPSGNTTPANVLLVAGSIL